MKNSSISRKEVIIGKILQIVREKMAGERGELIAEFIRQYYSAVALEDLEDRDIMDLYGAALSHWNLIYQRKPNEVKVRIYNPHYEQHGWQSTHTIIEISHDDMPFLVDSVRMEINRFNFTTHWVIHVGDMKVRRNKENQITEVLTFAQSQKSNKSSKNSQEASIYIEIDRQTDAKILEKLKQSLERILEDVRLAVQDWKKIISQIDASYDALNKNPPKLPEHEIEEAKDFIAWVRNKHFTFIGSRDYKLITKEDETALHLIPGSSLGVLRDESQSKRYRRLSDLPAEVRRLLLSDQMLIIYKTSTRSTIHRPAYTDAIDVKLFDKKGQLVGIRRFIGLYTSAAYNSSPTHIPFLRLKVRKVMEQAQLSPKGHAGKALINILETLPRDDLFQASTEELAELSLGILGLQERHRIRLFVRKDIYNRFVSCLVYVPREQFNTELRREMQKLLVDEFEGLEVSFSTYFSESVLARIHFIIRVNAHERTPDDMRMIERKLIEIGCSWQDRLRDSLLEFYGEEKGNALVQLYGCAFPASYQELFSARSAIFDIEHIEKLVDETSLAMSLYRPLDELGSSIRFKLFSLQQSLPLSDVLPLLEKMGFRVISEQPHAIKTKDERRCWINDFNMEHAQSQELDVEKVKDVFQEAFVRVWRGEAESDSFNSLVITAELNWREVAVLRAYAKYLRQVGFLFSQQYIESALTSNPHIAQLLVKLFNVRFAPEENSKREQELATLEEMLLEQLEHVANLDEDRILRRYLDVIKATVRTNYFQKNGKDKERLFLSFKLLPAQIPEVPLPLPMFEIFVYSPRFEGVHLRSSGVARGGLRWSDRREDFRTEILGLMKAQKVKNAVIVPSGAKGGFVPKCLPIEGSREQMMQEVVSCYKDFIRGLLCIADNLKGGKVVPPENTQRYDEEDYYLVVAADKGTATFSDIANSVSEEFGFWLGDAFASGGMTGYDHKKMAITARGAWESVKLHFRELGLDTQSTNFSVIGIGDMAGDVFGNGMLLSEHICLVGAFNHMHIFIDPTPDPKTSYAERKRLFELPRSNWDDYNAELISKGGGVFRRSAKYIKLTPEIKSLFEIKQDTIVPNDLLRIMLKAKVDLIWNGGIGTFIKAVDESNDDVGDRNNDAIRINGSELRCRVFGEGGNLGATQLGRIEYALTGGRLNTDFIDNSAGVDCSDNEVNIKILLDTVVTSGDMTQKQRNQLLASMTDEVAALVLDNNYCQTRALSLAEKQSASDVDLFRRYIHEVENAGVLNRELEFLPDDQTLLDRKAQGQGLTRPEFSVLLAYAKLVIKEGILDSNIPDDPYLSKTIETAFPLPLRKNYRKEIYKHRLSREIIATQLSNELVNEMGITFVSRLYDETGSEIPSIVRAYALAKEVFSLPDWWSKIAALDLKISVDTQLTIMLTVIRLVRRATRWFLRNRRGKLDIMKEIKLFKAGINEIAENFESLLHPTQQQRFNTRANTYIEAGVPEELAKQTGKIKLLFSSLDIVDTALQYKLPVTEVAAVYFSLGERLELTWFRDEIMAHPVENHWDALARAAFRDDLDWQQRGLALSVILQCKEKKVDVRVGRWIEQHQSLVDRWQTMLSGLRSTNSSEFTMFSVALRELMDLTQTGLQEIAIEK